MRRRSSSISAISAANRAAISGEFSPSRRALCLYFAIFCRFWRYTLPVSAMQSCRPELALQRLLRSHAKLSTRVGASALTPVPCKLSTGVGASTAVDRSWRFSAYSGPMQSCRPESALQRLLRSHAKLSTGVGASALHSGPMQSMSHAQHRRDACRSKPGTTPSAPTVSSLSNTPRPIRRRSARSSNEWASRLWRAIVKGVTLYRQGDVNFIVNAEPDKFAQSFARLHGPIICAIAFRVPDAAKAYRRAIECGACRLDNETGPMELNIPAIEGDRRFTHLFRRPLARQARRARHVDDVDFCDAGLRAAQ